MGTPTRRRYRAARMVPASLLGLGLLAACGEGPESSPYASEVVRFEPGEGAGYGQDELPDVVLGAPDGRGREMGALDVLSLGIGGEIVVGFEQVIVDGEGPDFVVFENSFWPAGDATQVFAELAEVAVSEDGERWATFDCIADPAVVDVAGATGQAVGEVDEPGRYPGCAGWTPTLEYDARTLIPIDAALTGGDAFDLADVGLERASFVRIRDLADDGQPPNAGFDLDAVGIIHAE